MENLTLTIIEQKDVFDKALYFLNRLKSRNKVQDSDINEYINQMINNKKDETYDDDICFIIIDINFKNEFQAKAASVFWNSVCEEAKGRNEELYEVAFQMYYGIIMALEEAKSEGEC